MLEWEAFGTASTVVGTSLIEIVRDQGFDAIFTLEALSDCNLNVDRALTACTGGFSASGQKPVLRLAPLLRAYTLFPCFYGNLPLKEV